MLGRGKTPRPWHRRGGDFLGGDDQPLPTLVAILAPSVPSSFSLADAVGAWAFLLWPQHRHRPPDGSSASGLQPRPLEPESSNIAFFQLSSGGWAPEPQKGSHPSCLSPHGSSRDVCGHHAVLSLNLSHLSQFFADLRCIPSLLRIHHFSLRPHLVSYLFVQ